MQYYSSQPVSPIWIEALKALDASYDSFDFPSATGLLQPPQIYQLERRHDAVLRVNVCRQVNRLFGSSLDLLFATFARPADITQRRMFIQWDSHTRIPFKPDLLRYAGKDGEGPYYDLVDLKGSKVKRVMHDSSADEHTAQLNLYAYGCEMQDDPIRIRNLFNEFIMPDWTKDGPVREPGRYPPDPMISRQRIKWRREQVIELLSERIALHRMAMDVADAQLPPCTREERWASVDEWKVQKTETGRTVPNGIFKTQEEAQIVANSKTYDCTVVHVPGYSKRCEDGWCPCKSVCWQYRREINPAF